jgi:hypothetical protein
MCNGPTILGHGTGHRSVHKTLKTPISQTFVIPVS